MKVGQTWMVDDVIGWSVDGEGKAYPVTLGLPSPWENPYAIEMADGSVRYEAYHYDTFEEFKSKRK